MTDVPPGRERLDCVLIVGGKFHDFDYARLELLTLLAENNRIRTRLFEDFEHPEAISAADFIVTYTCDVIPSELAQAALRTFVGRGGRLYALHGTNSILRFVGNRVDTPDLAPDFMAVLGTSFASHPAIGPYRVEVTRPDHPLCADIEPFDVTDELYLTHARAPIEVLLHVDYAGETPNFTHSHWPAAAHPVLYIRRLGEGQVLYLTLGHCRSHHDLRPVADWWPQIDRGSWDHPSFRLLLRRGLAWASTAAGGVDRASIKGVNN